MQHRICHFGDAYNFMRTGTCLLEAIQSSPTLPAFLDKLYKPAAEAPNLINSVTSMNLTDRLLIDGPVYSGYLAFVEWLSGVNASTPIFETYCLSITLANSVVDAIGCVFVYWCARLAFNRKVALLAGILSAIYPAAIINTQHCYSEPFSGFLLSGWMALTLYAGLRHKKDSSVFKRAASWGGLGLASGFLMLSKPAFAILPGLTAGLFTLLYLASARSRKPALPLVPGNLAKNTIFLLAGLAVVLVPWMAFNKAATGQLSIFVNRVPSFNIFHGNQLSTDGWRVYPYRGSFPGESAAVIESLVADACRQPGPFAALELKKIARLWSGVWNEYHYNLFGIPLEAQSLAHQLLLYLALLGGTLALFGSRCWQYSRTFEAGLLLTGVTIFHFAYLPFETISRYAFTAMPAVIILAALAITFLNRKRAVALLFNLLPACLTFYFLGASLDVSRLLAAFLPEAIAGGSGVLTWLSGTAAVAFLTFQICAVLKTAVDKSLLPFARAVPAIAALLVSAVLFANCMLSNDWKEWSADVSSSRTATQVIRLPANNIIQKAPVAFILLDMSSDTLAPPVVLTLNGTQIADKPFPLAQLKKDNLDIIQCLAIQAEGMGRDVRSFRHWWVIPVPSNLLRSGNENSITVESEPGNHLTLYGDRLTTSQASKDVSKPDGVTLLPSLESYSYTKGFTTFDHRDPRVFEPVEVLGETRQSSLSGSGKAQAQDLSNEPGIQTGRYRIRILIPSGYASSLPAAKTGLDKSIFGPVTFGAPDKSITVNGGDPLSFSPAGSPVSLPEALAPGTRFFFSCQLLSVKGESPPFVSLNFTGTDELGKQSVWNSQWQPIGIPLERGIWKRTIFSDIIPDRVLKLKGLQVKVLLSPFQPDFLFLKRKDALRSSMEAKDCSFSLLDPLPLPDLDKRTWLVY